MDADVIVVGAGLAGLVATAELADAGKKVLLLDQEPEQSLGGQAFWSLGGLFLVDSPEQRRMGIKDSYDLALQDWMGSAQFDRESDYWPRKWAEAYVGFAAGEKRQWLYDQGLRVFPVVGWAERGGGLAGGHGNSVPRFHLTWGTGPGVVAPFERRVREAMGKGLVELRNRHQVDELVKTDGTVTGVRGTLLAPDSMERGEASNRESVGDFEYAAQAVIVTSGGIGGNHDQVRKQWPVDRLGQPPKFMVAGVPAHVDGRMQFITEAAGAEIINPDRMWHYCEGVRNWNPIWANHGIRILPGPSSLWLSATGERFGAPYLPGFDTLGTLGEIMRTGYEYSWFVLTQKVIEKEFALSGSEQNPDLTGKDIKLLLSRVKAGAPGPVEAFKQHGEDFVVAKNVSELVAGMNKVAGNDLITVEGLTRTITERDRELDNAFSKDVQITYLRQHRSYRGDKLIRVASPHKFLDEKNGPLIAVRLNILTRKTLGGLHTDLDARVLQPDGTPLPGVYAAGEVAGFGGGGVHGYNALEGTFLGGCIFSGRTAGRAAAAALG
ncbi:FAD-binding dehydrogenase [Nocardioides marmorisolisilvae]|uniref:FAD-binding dehydrogenase n=1 Tax=Nocardioides marmorisolisilvae TaxID=1542737 RepID=A0A3N0DJR6_9ACTN|nr:FAD-binding dehydrogenase [Nocardioides marmorisolisilvae]RNL75483.1 FAD-binding dehydrogenase [Nocardioides marmorisolisilvae]